MDTNRTPSRRPRVAYSYVRLSSPEQIKGQGLTRQTKLAEEYAEQHSLTLSSQTFRDLGVSAYTGSHVTKGALAEFIGLVERGKISKGSVLLIEQLDRWSRQQPLDALSHLQKLLKLGIEVVTLTDGKSYTKESLGENIGDLFYSLAVLHRAHDESLTKSRRGRANWQLKRQHASTKPLTRMAPGWLELQADGKTWRVVKERARVVERVFHLTADGHGRVAIANRMNREHVPPPTRRGKHWHPSTVQKILASPAVIGVFQPGRRETLEGGRSRRVVEGEPIEGYYPAIISKRLWLRTRSTAHPPIPPGPKREGLSNVFSGLLVCGLCKASIHFVDKGRGQRYLICANARRALCPSRGWRYASFEPLVLKLLHRCIKWDTLVPSQRREVQSTLKNMEEQLAGVEVDRASNAVKLGRIVEAIETGAKLDTLVDRMRTLEAERATFENRAREIRQRVEAERERLRSLQQSAEENRGAFENWQRSQGGKHREESRHRLAVVLRDMLSRIVLTSHGTKHGPATEPRRLEVVFRSEQEAPGEFLVAADLSTVYDQEGEMLSKLG